eukprot:Anaeramoba_ignava/a218041_17.p2 GENE.a218041_17~~a218041_17.p2  ORF type:complete len:167 (-),score=52.11 a218041_17:43-543(-)
MLEMVKKSIQGRDVEKNLFLSLTQDGMYLFAPRNDDIDEDDKKISEQNQKAIMNMMSQLRNMENIYKPHEATQIELISVVSRHDHINQRIELMNQFINLLENVDQSQTPSSHKFIVEFLHKDLVIVNSLMKFAEKKKKRKKKRKKKEKEKERKRSAIPRNKEKGKE